MSLQWTLVASFLYTEIAIVFLLVVPIASARRWQKIFKSRFLQALASQAQWYFGFIVFVLILFLLDAIREIRKYSSQEYRETAHSHLETEMQSSMRLFRAQRNFYISGFSLFLCLVIRRLILLINVQATLQNENEVILKQAKSATSAAQSLLDQGAGEAAQNSSNEAHQKEIQKLNEKIVELEENLEKAEKDKVSAEKDKEAVVSQSKAIEKEYDRLTEECRKLQLALKVQGDKKEE